MGTEATLPDGSPLPLASNTGPVAGTVFTMIDATHGHTISTAGTVLENCIINGYIDVEAPNVTIRNCKSMISGGAGSWLTIHPNATNTLIENCEFDGTHTDSFPILVQAATTIKNTYFHDITGNAAMMAGGSLTFTGNYLEKVGFNASGIASNPLVPSGLFSGNAHVEDLYLESGPFAVISGNNFNTPIYETVDGIHYLMSTCTIFSDPYSKGDEVGPVTISNNVIAGSGEPSPGGGGLLFYLLGQGGYAITGNRIGALLPGAAYIYGTYIGSPWKWSGNTDDSGAAIPIPTGLPVAGTD